MPNEIGRPLQWLPHSSHWGAFFAAESDGRIYTRSHPDDPAPPQLFDNLLDAPSHKSRVRRPSVRRGWLDARGRPDGRRGADAFVEMSWDEVIPIVASELRRVRDEHSPQAIFGGSYGWSSAGRFHHAQSQVHRFLNTAIGGYTRSVGSYSAGAAEVILPHVIGPMDDVIREEATWTELAEVTELVVSFGGMPIRNAAVSAGGISRHSALPSMLAARKRGADFILFSPVRDDLPEDLEFTWFPNRPMSDTAIILALACTMIEEDLYDRSFVEQFCHGFEQFRAYVMGEIDGCSKSAEWAEGKSEISAGSIRALARRMVRDRTLIVTSNSLQRAEHGEQPIWAAVALAALTGQLGIPGAGFTYSLGSIGNVGKKSLGVPIPTLNQGRNGVSSYIPVARISDVLLNPGQLCQFNGRDLMFPDIRLVYWAGGNPFHHHQDISRLRRAFSRPDTIIVHEQFWTATARNSDIVLPATMTLEREDIGASKNDPKLVAMHRIIPPSFDARDDFDIFADLALELGAREAFTEGRSKRQWLEHLFEQTRGALAAGGHEAPSFAEFWERGELELPLSSAPGIVRAFLADPMANPLPTPSGKVELFSSMIAGFGYEDCHGVPSWFEPEEGLASKLAARFPLQLVANQPTGKLHSQLDFGRVSQQFKRAGREIVRINPVDARARDIRTNDIVRIYNYRGSCLAVALVSEDVRSSVIQLPTGAWFTPFATAAGEIMCLAGNPNVLTRDAGTSRLAQGSCGQLTLVDIELWTGEVPAVDPYDPPHIVQIRDDDTGRE